MSFGLSLAIVCLQYSENSHSNFAF
ncbi:hypothetical protein Pint_31794 [Pistacia integerrima]|uniref:Uncharacterized protein n=1 Tax=Pistacia integerrima TaxID=434235 RepID=A0ACC0XR81_9ROSI|nr:hypothetical protein Pint_31794 [Pistacia integerrima]